MSVRVCVLLIAMMLAFPQTTKAFITDEGDDTVLVFVNGRKLVTDPPPLIMDGRVLVPMRPLLEALGATVSWDNATETAVAHDDEHLLMVTIGQMAAFIDDTYYDMDVPAKLIGSRTFLPLRLTAQAFGSAVQWDGELHIAWVFGRNSSEYDRVMAEVADETFESSRNAAMDKLIELMKECDNPNKVQQTCQQGVKTALGRWFYLNYNNGRLFDLKRQVAWVNARPFTWHGYRVNSRDVGNINYGYVLSYFIPEELIWDFAGLQEIWTLRNQGQNPISECFKGNYRCEDPDSARGIMMGIEYYHERTGR